MGKGRFAARTCSCSALDGISRLVVGYIVFFAVDVSGFDPRLMHFLRRRNDRLALLLAMRKISHACHSVNTKRG